MTEFQMHDASQMYLTNFWKDFTLHGNLKMKGTLGPAYVHVSYFSNK